MQSFSNLFNSHFIQQQLEDMLDRVVTRKLVYKHGDWGAKQKPSSKL